MGLAACVLAPKLAPPEPKLAFCRRPPLRSRSATAGVGRHWLFHCNGFSTPDHYFRKNKLPEGCPKNENKFVCSTTAFCRYEGEKTCALFASFLTGAACISRFPICATQRLFLEARAAFIAMWRAFAGFSPKRCACERAFFARLLIAICWSSRPSISGFGSLFCTCKELFSWSGLFLEYLSVRIMNIKTKCEQTDDWQQPQYDREVNPQIIVCSQPAISCMVDIQWTVCSDKWNNINDCCISGC